MTSKARSQLSRVATVSAAGIFAGLFLNGQAHAATGAPAVDSGAKAWMLTSTALVLLMVPGLAMFYGGLVRTKNVSAELRIVPSPPGT